MSGRSQRGAAGGIGMVVAAVLLLAGCSGSSPTSGTPDATTPAAAPTPTPSPTASVTPKPTGTPTAFAELTIGMCLTDLAGSLQVEAGTVSVVPCSEPHSSEVYSLPGLPGDPYPGDEGVAGTATDACTNDFAAYVGQSVSVSDLDPGVYVPDQAGWSAGERRAVCVVFYPKGDVIGSVKGIGATPPQLAP